MNFCWENQDLFFLKNMVWGELLERNSLTMRFMRMHIRRGGGEEREKALSPSSAFLLSSTLLSPSPGPAQE